MLISNAIIGSISNNNKIMEPVKSQFLTRLKSLLWRTGAMIVVIFISAVLDNMGALHITGQTAVFVGLIGGEITKYLNNLYQDAKTN